MIDFGYSSRDDIWDWAGQFYFAEELEEADSATSLFSGSVMIAISLLSIFNF